MALLTELSLSPISLKTARNNKHTRKTLEMNLLRHKSPVLAVSRPLPRAPCGRFKPDAGLPSRPTSPGSDLPACGSSGRSLRLPSELCRFVTRPITQPGIAPQHHSLRASIIRAPLPSLPVPNRLMKPSLPGFRPARQLTAEKSPTRHLYASAISTGGSRPAAKGNGQWAKHRVRSPREGVQHVQDDAQYML
jgi:hypothetical protein